MNAMVLKKIGAPLEWTELADRHPRVGEVRVKVAACGVCRTDLHVVDGELPNPHVPIIPGHEIVGRIDALGAGVEGLSIGERVGIPWLGHTCGVCPYCAGGHENLCDHPIFTGFTRDGGFANATIADARFVFPLGETGSDVSLSLKIPPGTTAERDFRLRGKGLPSGDGTRGDLHAISRIQVPSHPTPEEKVLWEQLAAGSKFNPRNGHEQPA